MEKRELSEHRIRYKREYMARKRKEPGYSEYQRIFQMRRYGITVEQYEEMKVAQKGLCKICQTPPTGGRYPTLHVDHDHVSGKVRGLICYHCNYALGHLKDDPVRAERLVAYLRGVLN